MITAKVREKINNKQAVYGTFVKAKDPGLIEVFGYAGFDFVIIDAEHGSASFPEIESLVRAADCAGISPIVRITGDETDLMRTLDVGASGVMIPSLNSVEQARKIAAYAKYSPKGRRGISTDQRSANYGFNKPGNYFTESNEKTMLMLQIECKELLEVLDEFLDIPQLDLVFIGPGDLSNSFGKAGQLECAEVQDAIRQITSACLGKNIPVGIFAGTEAQVKKYRQMGIQLIAFSTDFMLYGKMAKEVINLMRCTEEEI